MSRMWKGGEVGMKKEYIVDLTEEEADELMDEHWVGELVRCKDCKHLEHIYALDELNGKKCYVCRKHPFTGMRDEDWFCADGVRQK